MNMRDVAHDAAIIVPIVAHWPRLFGRFTSSEVLPWHFPITNY